MGDYEVQYNALITKRRVDYEFKKDYEKYSNLDHQSAGDTIQTDLQL